MALREVPILLSFFLTAVLGCEKTKDVYREGELTANDVVLKKGERDIAFVGDIMTWDRAREYVERYGAEYPFAATAPFLKQASVTVGNLEGPVASAPKMGKGKFVYRVMPWTLKGLKWAGFDVVSMANNHVADCGTQGITETMENLNKVGIAYFGAGKNESEAYAPKVVDVGGLKIAFIGAIAGDTYFSEYENSLGNGVYEKMEKLIIKRMGAGKNKPGAAVVTKKNVAHMFEQARRSADIVIAEFHFGIRYHRQPEDFQRDLAHSAIDAGADLVVGHHAHFWQPVEVYRNKPIIYGIGNFAFGSLNKRADEALMARAIIAEKKISRVELVPLYIKNRDEKVAFQPKVMKGASAIEMLERVRQESAPWKADISIENGRGVLMPAPNVPRQ